MAAYLAQASTRGSDQVRTTSAQALQSVFKTITAASCPRIFNFHMHTVYSDGQLQPEAILQQALAIGLRGLAITDHHTLRGYGVARARLNDLRQEFGAATPDLWTGIEISAGLLGTEVHILGYAFDSEPPALQPYLQGHTVRGHNYEAGRVIAAIHEAGGLAVLAHPARYRRSPVELISAAAELGIDGVETYYSYGNAFPWQPSPKQTQQVYQLGEAQDLLHTCGTDTHGLSILRRL